MIFIQSLFVFLVISFSPANGYSCDQIRDFVSRYGRVQAEQIAIQHGMTKEQRKQALKCLKIRK